MAHFCKKLQADCRRGWMLALTAMLIVFAPAAFAQSAPTVTGTVTERRYDGRGRLLFPQTARGGGILLT